MKRSELNALKAKIREQKEMGADFDKVMNAFAPLTDAVKALLPADVLVVLEKYGYTGEETE